MYFSLFLIKLLANYFSKLTLSGFYRIWKNIRIRFVYHNNDNVWVDLSHEIFGKKTFWDEISLFQNSSIENRLFKVFNKHNFQFKYDIYIENILKTIWMYLDPKYYKKCFMFLEFFSKFFIWSMLCFLKLKYRFNGRHI